jgi:hypothetical protein
MTDNEYLQAVLKAQELSEKSQEWKDLINRKEQVEKLLRDAFPDSSPTIRYGGSKAKGTLIIEMYDLDIVCYFPNNDTSAGETLEDIYNNVAAALEKEYTVVRKRSALRLQDKQRVDFHIDVVPGRFTDNTKTDCYLYQKDAEKCRLKTNLDVHIRTIRDSGLLDPIRLLKLWKARKALQVKQFAFELLIIDLESARKTKPLTEQLTHVWEKIRDLSEPPKVEDPANTSGNDLTPLLTGSVWSELQNAAKSTLQTVEDSDWEAVFGKIESEDSNRSAAIRTAVASVAVPTRQWRP